MSSAVPARPLRQRAWLLLPLGLLLAGLGQFGLLNNVEGMYAEISREMLASHDLYHWIIPHLNGLPYIEKPPLLYWLQAVLMGLFGVSDGVARLAPTLATAVTLLTLYGYGRALPAQKSAEAGPWMVEGEARGILAAFAFGTTVGVAFLCKIGMTDPLLTAGFTGAVLTSHLAWLGRNRRRLCWAMAWLALAVLTKGLLALVLYLGIWAAYGLLCEVRQRWVLLRFLLSPVAWGVFGLLTLWHGAAALSLNGFAWFYFINEHVLRFLGLREPKDYYSGSAFYYLPRLFLLFFPWSLWWLGSALKGLQERWQGRLGWPALPSRKDGGWASPEGFWLCAVLVPFAFFSASAAKANYYVVLCLPGLALLSGQRLWQRGWWLPLTGRWAQWRRFDLLAATLALVAVPLMAYALSQARGKEAEFSARPLAAMIRAQTPAGADWPVYLYQDFEDASALPFYLQASVRVIDVQSQDLAFALKRERDPLIYPSVEAFAAGSGPAWVVVMPSRQRHPLPPALAEVLVEAGQVAGTRLYRRR